MHLGTSISIGGAESGEPFKHHYQPLQTMEHEDEEVPLEALTDGPPSLDKVLHDTDKTSRVFRNLSTALANWGIETHGSVNLNFASLLSSDPYLGGSHHIHVRRIAPVPPEARTDVRLYQMFLVWFSANMNILAFSTGSAGPLFFGLGARDSIVIVFLVDLIVCAIPAYFAVFGPKLGTRGMVQSRFSWGYYGSILPSVLNVFSMQGFLILNCIIGGQTLASVSDQLNDTLGIVIIGVISLVVTFCGYKVIHWYESIAWIPNVITFIVMLGIGGKHLHASAPPPTPATAASVLSFVSTVASSVISWCTMTPDYGVYHDGSASSMRIFIYTYLGFFTSSITGHMIGAAFAAAAPSVPSWTTGLGNGNDVGGLIAAILSPAGNFGKFLTAILALSIPSACAPTMYTFSTSFMTVAPFFARIPRYVFIIISEAVLIPVAVVGATRFYTTFVDILSVIGYWSTAFAAIIFAEHFIFRKNKFSLYDIDDWDQPRRLPPGFAAVLAFLGAFGIIVPSMSQAWYTGPFARAGTGDIGIETGFIAAGLLYVCFRRVERRFYHVGRLR
ncbi:hypothetical protein JAAARDRAFT_32429 [Jaapia argillacea MUCL 33604]|uniref:Purine-cytosine permease n=1 Tax=Jaapia argillacea MUCL 33604 TaxID=933084 RepID=A0A067Q976_9AGAM|nr:hypothetical protein JAAARDRAFT_32429 [Jaapia argillacea MUCL 33604]